MFDLIMSTVWWIIYLAICCLIAILLYVTYRIYTGYYRTDIPLDKAFKKEDFDIFCNYNKAVVVGCGCSGKSSMYNM